MKTYFKSIENYLLNSTTWLFAMVIGLMSILMTQDSTPQSWKVYFSFLAVFMVFSLPVLLFSIFRNRLEARVSSLTFRLIWGSCFIGFPILVHLTKAYSVFYIFFRLCQLK